MKKKWIVRIRETKEEYKLAAMNFEHAFIGIHTDKPIRKQYGYKEVQVFHGDREIDLNRGEIE